MSDRAKGFVVTLGDDLREEDAERLREAIAMLKGVVAVEPLIANPGDHAVRSRMRVQFWEALRRAFDEVVP